MVNVDIVELSCCQCKVSFWITDRHNKELLEKKGSFYCPNGHSQNYVGQSDAQKLADKILELDKVKKDIAKVREEKLNMETENDKLKKSIASYKLHLAKKAKAEAKP